MAAATATVRHGMFFRFGVHVSPDPREAPQNPHFARRCTPVQAREGFTRRLSPRAKRQAERSGGSP